MKDLKWKVGGAQGEGIDSTGEIFAITLNRLGYYLYAYRHFMSLIKGGHTNYKVRISSEPVNYHGDDLDILLAFDQRTIDENHHELKDGSILIYDSSKLKDAKIPEEGKKVNICPIPIYDIAQELGNSIMKNMVAAGASCAAVGLDVSIFHAVIEDIFSKKGEQIINKNKEAIQKGFDYYQDNFDVRLEMPEPNGQPKKNIFLTGNEAVGLGALAAGCRFLAAYPITPATEVMYTALAYLPKFGGKIIQAEDEIAACLMAIGGNYVGTRSMTSTSGPGLSLMMEALGLSGISETPLVIIDVQRGGPGTGLPTKTEQSDINEMIYGSHGEIPRIVMTPTTAEEAFYFTQHAFNLAEKYQCPVIVGTDLMIGMSKKSVPELDFEQIKIERSIISQEELNKYADGSFKRYALDVENGISPRSIPGQPYGRYVALGNEHEETGIEIEDPETRIAMMDKRMKKLDHFDPSEIGVYFSNETNIDTLMVGFGSTFAQIQEAHSALKEQGMNVGHLQLKILEPFPTEKVKEIIGKAKKVLVVDNNATGQLNGLLKREVNEHDKFVKLLKYDGNPFTIKEIIEAVKGQEVNA